MSTEGLQEQRYCLVATALRGLIASQGRVMDQQFIELFSHKVEYDERWKPEWL